MKRPEPEKIYDVAIIGAGVVGCAIAKVLSRFELDCVLVEAGPDVGTGTSKANTAILHTGFDSKSGTLESKLVQRGYRLLKAYAEETGIPLERTGGLLIAWESDQEESLPRIWSAARRNGVDVQRLTGDTLYQLEPELGPGARAGLKVPGESTICPFTTTLAYATQAVVNGVDLYLNSPVSGIDRDDGLHRLSCPHGDIASRYLVNAAGLHSDSVNRMVGHDEFTIQPRRGELIVFDKFASALIDHILLPVPGKMGKGVLISPTVYGNVLLGPTSEDIGDKDGRETTAAGLSMLIERGRKILPALLDEEITATYAGIRAATDQDDYRITSHPDQKYVCVGGIRSTGLSASLAIGEFLLDLLADAGLELREKPVFRSVGMPNIGEFRPRPYQTDMMIRQNPEYGEIICHCEKVTLGEIKAAFRSPLPPPDLDGLRRRTRVLMGRCQGFYCHANVLALLNAGREIQFSNRGNTGP